MAALSEQHIKILTVLYEALVSEKIDLSLEEIKDQIKAKFGNDLTEIYISKLISSLRKSIPENAVKSFFFRGHKRFQLRGDYIVTRKKTAAILLELRKATAPTGKVSRDEFLERAKNSEALADVPAEFIQERIAWAEKINVGYIESRSETEIAPTDRVYDELSYLFAITEDS